MKKGRRRLFSKKGRTRRVLRRRHSRLIVPPRPHTTRAPPPPHRAHTDAHATDTMRAAALLVALLAAVAATARAGCPFLEAQQGERVGGGA